MCLYRNTFFFLFKIYFLRSVTEQIRNTKTFWASQVNTSGKNLSANAGDVRQGFDPWVRKIPGMGNGNPLQYFDLENPVDQGVWWATVHGVAQSQTRLKQLSMHSGNIVDHI